MKKKSPSHTIGTGPSEPRYSETLKFLGETIDEFLNGDDKGRINERRVGFVLMVFPFGEDRAWNYISNTEIAIDRIETLESGRIRARCLGYEDPSFPERNCDRCGRMYRGPAVYCSLKCALGDA